LARIPYVDHIVDGVEKQIYEYNLDNDDCIEILTRVSEMIKDIQFARYFENKIL